MHVFFLNEKSRQGLLRSSFQFFQVVECVIIFSRKIILQLLVCASGVPAAEQDEVKRNGGGICQFRFW